MPRHGDPEDKIGRGYSSEARDHRSTRPGFWMIRRLYLPLASVSDKAQHSACSFRARPIFRLARLIFVLSVSFLTALLVFVLLPWPLDPFDSAFRTFRDDSSSLGPDSARYPQSFLRTVHPVPCHSHNDYWRSTPLYSALGTGCVGVEADVWLVGSELYVGHTEESLALAPNGTLREMYLNPLTKILESANTHHSDGQHQFHGIFDTEPSQTLTMLIDIKTGGAETWPYLHDALAPLRERGWLTHWNGTHRVLRPLTVVGTGSTPYDLVVANQTYRDIFLDAPLEALVHTSDVAQTEKFKYNPSNSHYASTKLDKAIGSVRGTPLSSEQLATLRQQIKDAHVRGLIPRYWGTPRWPRGLRDQIWDILLKEDVGVLNVDDLRAVRKGHWGFWPS